MNEKKQDLSNKILDIVLKEVPIENLSRGSVQDADEYFDIVSDALTSVLARLSVSYIGCLSCLNPDLTEEEITNIAGALHYRLSNHIDFEAGDFMNKLSEKKPMDA
jgi:hypothetical protein